MPSALMLTEDALPKYNESESDEQRIKDIYSYLFMLVEQLRYSLANLGASNFNDTELGLIGEGITEDLDAEVELITKALVGETGSVAQIIASGDALIARITDAEDKAAEAIMTVDGLRFSVSDGDGNSTVLTLMSGNTALDSATITITGVVTFNDLEKKGATKINGGNITTGTITAIDISACDVYGSNIHGSDITLYYESDQYDDCELKFMWGGTRVGTLGFDYDEDVSDTPAVSLSSRLSTDLMLTSANDLYIWARRGAVYLDSADYIKLQSDAVLIDNPTLYDTDGGEWTFSREGIFRNGILHFPI